MPILHISSHFITKISSNLFCSKNPFLHTQNLTLSSKFKMSSAVPTTRPSSLSSLAPLEAILFDIDGTLCDSDHFHYTAFRDMLLEIGYNGGEPITEEYYIKHISGGDNELLCHSLFPDWEIEKARKFLEDKEALFRKLASELLEPNEGLEQLTKWIKDHGLRRAAVTNAPRVNAELMISAVGLKEFFELMIVGSECERPKPFPDPYLRAVKELGLSAEHTFIFEDSIAGIKAGVAAGMPVVGLTTRTPENLLLEAGATMVIKDFADPKLWAELEGLVKKTEAVKASI